MIHFSKTQILAFVLCLIASTYMSLAQSEFNPDLALPDIGDSAGSILSPAEEVRLGKEFMRNLRRSQAVLNDLEVEQYLQNLGLRLTSFLKQQNYEFKFFIVDSPAINAFAAPGGYIGINSGLILATQSEGELASVIAHEIVHVNQRHIARQFENTIKTSIPLLAAMVTAIILSGQDSDATYAAITAGLAGATQLQLNFTRSNEQEADRVGVQLLTNAGFNPYSMALFFHRLEQKSQYSDFSSIEFLLTHPVPVSRISDILSRARQYETKTEQSSLNFHLMRQRLRVITENKPQKLKQEFLQEIQDKQYLNEYAARYGYVLALQRIGDYKKARTELRKLIDDDQERASYSFLLAEIESASNDYKKASQIYNNALKLHPGNQPLLVNYADSLLRLKKYKQSSSLLYEMTLDNNAHPNIYKLLAQAENALGSPVNSHASLAEYFYLMGDTMKAIEHLEIALKKYKPNDLQKSSLEKRLKQMRFEAIREGVDEPQELLSKHTY
jgi:predicted Zn-dependent protease